jgi:hypothetical protein
MYPPEVVAEIKAHVLAEVATGRSVSRILAEDDGMPAPSQFWRWGFQDEDYQIKLTRAREFGVEVLLDEIEDIADDSSSDVYIDYVGKGDDRNPVAKVDGDVIRRASLRIETRIKKAQMLAPRRYGPRVDVTSGGEKLEPGQVNDNRLQAIVGVVAQRKAAKALPKPEEETDNDPLS